MSDAAKPAQTVAGVTDFRGLKAYWPPSKRLARSSLIDAATAE